MGRKKIRLSYIEEDCIPLFKSIIKNMQGIEIFFEKAPINPSLVMLKGCLLNSGNTDIDDKMIHEPLAIRLPENSRWKRVIITDKSPDIKVTSKIINNDLEINWDLMKKGEYIRFDSLIDIGLDEEDTKNESGKSISKRLKFTHRITNLDKVKRLEKPVLKRFTRSSLWYMGFMALVIILSMFVSERRIVYLYEDDNGKRNEIRLIPKENDFIEIRGIRNKYSQRVKIEDIFSSHKITPIIVKVNQFKEARSMALFFLTISVLTALIEVIDRRKKKRLAKTIGLI